VSEAQSLHFLSFVLAFVSLAASFDTGAVCPPSTEVGGLTLPLSFVTGAFLSVGSSILPPASAAEPPSKVTRASAVMRLFILLSPLRHSQREKQPQRLKFGPHVAKALESLAMTAGPF